MGRLSGQAQPGLQNLRAYRACRCPGKTGLAGERLLPQGHAGEEEFQIRLMHTL